jgi:hypothetical protein
VFARTLAAAFALVVTGAAYAVATGHGATGPAVIRISDQETQRHVVRPAGGRTIGTVEIVRGRLYNKNITKKAIGRADFVCTYLDNQERTCTGSYFLPKGSLVVSGAIQSRLLYEVSIVGGTGLYGNARGTLTGTTTHLSPHREVLVFRLMG